MEEIEAAEEEEEHNVYRCTMRVNLDHAVGFCAMRRAISPPGRNKSRRARTPA